MTFAQWSRSVNADMPACAPQITSHSSDDSQYVNLALPLVLPGVSHVGGHGSGRVRLRR